MTPHQIFHLRSSWSKVVPIADVASTMFYNRLFEIAPDTQPLFSGANMEAQREKLISAIGLVVEKAEQLDALRPALEELGRSHVSYGVKDHHYDAVGAALIWTLDQGLCDDFTEEVRSAWTIAYALVSGIMRNAAQHFESVAA